MSVGKKFRGVLGRAVRSRWTHYAVSGAILAAIGFWLAPRRVNDVVAVDGADRWQAGTAPPRRHVVWQTPSALESVASPSDETASAELPDELPASLPVAAEATRVTPHFTDAGLTLLCAVRDSTGQFDLCESHRTRHGWSPPEPLAGINTPSDELGPCVSRDGRSLYFYSNRPGGLGGSDLYVATRTDDGWGDVQNLGPAVNSSAHEYEPAMSPNGDVLFFSSNRSRDSAARETRRREDSPADAWATTLRAAPGETTFDLYASRRTSEGSGWSPPRSLSLNRPDANEGAPSVSPDGAFLYFASDRPARPGERPNLDLYRARLRGDAAGEPVNLGPAINSAAHETEPAFTLEGHALVFSTNRDGVDRLYRSVAGEVEELAGWDASNLRAIGTSPWRLGLVAALMTLALLLVVADQRARLRGLSQPVRYFAASVFVHVVLLAVLLFMKMPAAIHRLANALEDEQRRPIEFEIQPTPTEAPATPIETVFVPAPVTGTVADLALERPAPLESSSRPSLAPARPSERSTPQLASIPREPLAMPPRRPAALPAESLPPEPEAKPAMPAAMPLLARRTVGSRAAAPVDGLDTPPPAAAPTVAATESELRTEPILGREKVAVPNRAPERMPLERLAGPARRPAVMPREVAAPSPPEDMPTPSPAPAAKQLALVPGRAASRPAAAAIDTTEETPLPAPKASAPAGEGEDMRAAASVARVATGSRAPSLGPELPATSPRVSVAPREPSLADRAVEPVEAIPRARGGVEVASVPRSRSAATSPTATLLDDVPLPAATASKESVESPLETPVTISGAARVKIVSSRGGVGGIPQPARNAERPSAGRVELARNEAPPAPALSPSMTPLIGRVAAGPAGRPAAAAVFEEATVAGPVAPAKSADPPSVDDRATVTATRIATRGPGLLGAASVTTPAPATRPTLGVVAASGIANATTPGLDASDAPLVATKLPAVQIARASGSPLRTLHAATLDDEAANIAAGAPVVAAPSPPVSGETGIALATVALAGRPAPGLRPNSPSMSTSDGGGGLVPRGIVPHTAGAGGEFAGDVTALMLASNAKLERTAPRGSRVALIDESTGMRSLFTMRQGEERKQYVELVGGTATSEKAVTQGLQWLKAVQEKDGAWSVQKHGAGFESVEGATGLALLPFLAAGQTHQSGEHREAVAAGVKWLVAHQAPDGALFPPGAHRPMYGHGIATIALCEAYGMTKDQTLREPTARALDFIVKAQHAASGGWRYLPNESADTSVVGWQVMALKSGEMAGLHTPRATLDNAARWLASVESNKPVGGQFGYLTVGSTPAMTAEGLLCLQFLGIDRNDPRMRAGADYLMQNLPHESAQTSYYWYYATQVMYHMQGAYWKAWNAPMRDQIVRGQVAAGANAGTWEPRDAYELRAGRLYTTALRLLILEVYYRHLPLYDQLGE